MEVVKRNITLTDFKNFNPKLNPSCIDCSIDENKWGKIPKDLIITETSIKNLKNIPLCLHDGQLVLRYYNIKLLYYFLENYDNNMEYYRLIGNDKFGYRWVEYNQITETVHKFSYIPSAEGFNCDDIIIVNPLQTEYEELFGDADITELRELLINYYEGNIPESRLSIPFINFNLSITTDTSNIGSYSNDLQKWEEEHDYEVNDMVFYDGSYYVCTRKHTSDLLFSNTNWKKLNNDPQKISSNKWGDVESSNLYSESCLHYFIPHRRTYDEQGKVLPFIILKEGVSRISSVLIYQKTCRNYQALASGVYVDELISAFLSIDGETWEDLSEDLNAVTQDGYFKCGSLKFKDYKFIKFIYTIGIILDENGDKIDNTGVRYEEVRRCEYVKNYISDYGRINYLNISNNSVYSEAKNYERPYAKITGLNPNNEYLTDSDLGIFKSSVHNFMDEALIGSTFVDFDIPEVNVNRGNYTAMERHYILGEVKSFDDLQNYRNNLFKL
jgi:hypothetical protein